MTALRADTHAPTKTASPSGAHILPLDGLRGVAVLLVLLGHYLIRAPVLPTVFGAGLHGLASVGGYGVDLFFVLSGFLITGILLDTRGDAHYFRNFYARRTLRILPLYYTALIVIFLVLPYVRPDLTGVPPVPFRQQLSYWGYFSNYVMAFGDWGASARHTPHFWSLAIEEQFYLVWPAVVLWMGGRRLIALCLWLIAGSLALRAGLGFGSAMTTLVLLPTPCRLDALAIGALIAAVGRRDNGMARLRLAFPGFVVALVAVLGLIVWRGNLAERDPVIGSFGISLMSVLFGTAVAIAVQLKPGTLLHAAFALRPLRFVGRYGYGIYVIHYPVMVILANLGWNYEALAARAGSPAIGEGLLVAGNLIVTLTLAVTSFHLLEKPFLALKSRFAYRASDAVRAPQATTSLATPAQST